MTLQSVTVDLIEAITEALRHPGSALDILEELAAEIELVSVRYGEPVQLAGLLSAFDTAFDRLNAAVAPIGAHEEESE